jgi:hypothetical protein
MSDHIPSKIVCDFMKLVYDPYLTGQNVDEWAF